MTRGENSDAKPKIKISGALAKNGYYRLPYAGNGTTGASSSAGDYVDVR